MEQRKKISPEGAQAFEAFANDEVYTCHIGFSTYVRKGFMCFTPLTLGMKEGTTFYQIMAIRDGKYTFAEMNVIIQVLSQVSGKAMGFANDDKGVANFLSFAEKLTHTAKDFGEKWNAALADFTERFPFVEVQDVVDRPLVAGITAEA